MTTTRFQPVDKSASGVKAIMSRTVNAERLMSLTTLEFIERLAETSVGQSLINESKRRGKQYTDDFLKDLASKYEDIGQSATDYFARRARATSVFVAIALACALNVNVVHLFQTLLTDKNIRQSWIEKGEKVAKHMEEQEAEFKKIQAQTLEQPEVDANSQLKSIKDNTKQFQSAVSSLRDSGLPVGWRTAPWYTSKWGNADRLNKSILFFQWFMAVLMAGLLIGLGGPFWFDIFKKLSVLTSAMRGLQTPVQKTKEQGQTHKGNVVTTEDSEFVKVFDTAAKGYALGAVRGRMFLTPEGHVDKGIAL